MANELGIMNLLKYLLIFLSIIFFGFDLSQKFFPPEGIDFAYDESISETVFEHTKTDTFSYELKIAYEEDCSPKFYYSKLITPVCETGACYLVTIVIYWDLVGAYLTYDLPRNRILTKIDHQHFEDSDYEKLNRILDDANWPLANFPVNDLIIDSTKTLVDSKVDGYTGATAPFVREKDNIKGALYTIYTLWEFVHDQSIINYLKNHTQTLLEDQKIQLSALLESERESYWAWSIKQLDGQQLNDELIESLLRLLPKCDSYLGYEVLKLIDSSSLSIQSRLWEIFKSVPIEKKQNIREKFSHFRIHNAIREKMIYYVEEVKNPMEKLLVKKMINQKNIEFKNN